MYQLITKDKFIDIFMSKGYEYSYATSGAIYDYIMADEGDGIGDEFDPIALRGEWSEYDNIDDFNKQNCTECESLEDVEDAYQVMAVVQPKPSYKLNGDRIQLTHHSKFAVRRDV